MIQGIGIPSKIKASGTIYKNKLNGVKYKQTLSPRGNVWVELGAGSSETEPFPHVLNTIYTLKKVLNNEDIANMENDSLEICEIQAVNNSECIIEVLDVESRYTGTAYNRNGTEFYIVDMEDDSQSYTIDSSIAFNILQNGYHSRQWTGHFMKKISSNETLRLGIIENINLGAGDTASGGGNDSELIIYITYYISST